MLGHIGQGEGMGPRRAGRRGGGCPKGMPERIGRELGACRFGHQLNAIQLTFYNQGSV